MAYMFMGEPKPLFLFKVLPLQTIPTNPLPSRMPRTDPDRDEGFIHIWRSRQMVVPLKLWYETAFQVIVLRVIFRNLQDNTRWDQTTDAKDYHPHLFRDLGGQDVESMRVLTRLPGQTWEQVVAANADWYVPGV